MLIQTKEVDADTGEPKDEKTKEVDADTGEPKDETGEGYKAKTETEQIAIEEEKMKGLETLEEEEEKLK